MDWTAILGAGGLNDQQGQLDQQLADLLTRRRAYRPAEHTTGLGALLGGIGDYRAQKRFQEQENALRGQRQDVSGKLAGSRGVLADAFTSASQPVQAPPDMIAAPGFDQASQERDQQQRLQQLQTAAMLSGDPTMTQYAQHQPQMAMQQEQLRKTQEGREAVTNPAGAALLRAVAGRFAPGVDVSSAPPQVLNQMMPTLEKGFAATESAQTRREAAQQSADLRKAMLGLQNQRFEATTGLKEDQFKAKRMGQLTDALNPFIRKGGLANYTQGINRAQKLDALLVDPATGQPKKLLTPQDMTETAIALQQLVANGHASQSEVDQLVPKSIGADAARGLQYFTGKPWDSGQQAWALRMLHTAHREADVNRGSILQALKQQLPQFGDIRSKYGSDYESTLKGAGINPAAFNEQGLPVEGVDMSLGTNAVLGDTQGGGMVDVVSPEGKAGKIPVAKLDAALKRGFRRAGP